MITTERLSIKELELEDVYDLFKWKRNYNLLIKEYDFLDASDGDPELWYRYRKECSRLKSFSVKSLELKKVIGFISIRNINKIFKSAILGITFDEEYIDKGYGTEALIGFLNYFFNILKMKTIILDVGKYNFRALNCYKKLGFEIKREYKIAVPRKFENLKYELIANPLQKENDTFILFGDILILIYYRMKLKSIDFNRIHNLNLSCG